MFGKKRKRPRATTLPVAIDTRCAEEEIAFIREIAANPASDEARLVYADWLEEHGDPRAEFLRANLHLAEMSPKASEYKDALERLRKLASDCDHKWAAIVSKVPIEKCSIRFKFLCPKQWQNLAPTSDATVRFCDTCQKNVYFCETIYEALDHAHAGDCVCVDIKVPRTEWDLDLSAELGGIVISDEDFERLSGTDEDES